jgi:putative ABC transport system permease protein
MSRGVASDLRAALRSLARSPGFLALTLSTLAVSLALSVIVMAVVNAYLLRGLPYPGSDRLYQVRFGAPNVPFVDGLQTLDWRSLDDVVEPLISWDLDSFNLRGQPHAEAAQGTWVTPGYMEAFGVRTALGRTFGPEDYRPGPPPVAIISHRLWQSRFHGDGGILGRPFEAYAGDRPNEPQTFTIVGVLPPDHWHMNIFTDVMSPLRAPSVPYMARLRDGVAPETAAARIEALVRSGGLTVPPGWSVRLDSAHEQYVLQIRPLLESAGVATLLVVLIACANVAVLFTLRASHRRREVAVRKALGASTLRVLRALAAEASVVGAAATLAGLALAQAIIRLAGPTLERHLGRPAPGGSAAIQIDALTAGAALAAGALVTALCMLAQVWASTRAPVALANTAGQKGGSAGPHQRRAHAALIAVEVATSLALLVGATLMVQSGLRILRVDMGLDADDVLVGMMTLSQERFPDATRRADAYERLAAGRQAIGGATHLAFGNSWPLQQAPRRSVGRDGDPGGLTTQAGVTGVSPEYFDALRIGIERGRAFGSADRAGAEPAVIISRTLAARLWPGREAVGERLLIGGTSPNQAPAPPPRAMRVVGIAGDVRHTHTDDDLADAYVSLLQSPSSSAFVYVRSTGAPWQVEAELRGLLARVDPDLALGMSRDLSAILDQQRAGARLLTVMLGLFSAFAGMLALVGIYGVIAYAVRQREREIAVRLAVGADGRRIMQMFLRQGAGVLLMGLALGVGAAFLLGRLLQSQLFGVDAADPVVMAAATSGFAVCGLLAVFWPARTAASTDPAIALKES